MLENLFAEDEKQTTSSNTNVKIICFNNLFNEYLINNFTNHIFTDVSRAYQSPLSLVHPLVLLV